MSRTSKLPAGIHWPIQELMSEVMIEKSQMSIIETLSVSQRYKLPRTKLLGPRPQLIALQDVNFHAMQGESVGIVGESGAGKSTLTRILVGLEKPTSGVLNFRGQNLWTSDEAFHREFRLSIQMVLQNPRSSFDPRMTIGTSLLQPLRSLKIECDHQERINEVLDQVGLGKDSLKKYPYEFSGGQLQRVAIARAIVPNPKILIADEPVSALDVSIQAQVLNLLNDLVKELGLTLILITHDLSVVTYATSRVAVMMGGRIVDVGTPRDLFLNPQSDTTRSFVDSVLTVGKGIEGESLFAS
jgi:ABC-type glutathione transport system ATPase component